jgi:hypothetical protein
VSVNRHRPVLRCKRDATPTSAGIRRCRDAGTVRPRSGGPRSAQRGAHRQNHHQRKHEERAVRWNLTDTEGNLVPDGVYAIVVESTDSLQTTAVTSVTFTKGPEPVTLTLDETLRFGPITLTYVPGDAP